MPTPQHFNALSEHDQHNAAIQGQFLADRRSKGVVIQLFSLPNYYVERHYDPSVDCVTRYEAFAETERLVPYLAHIKFNSPAS